MVDLLDDAQFLEQYPLLEQYQQAVAAAYQASVTEPNAITVHYDAGNHLIVIRLNSGAAFSFPPDIVQGLTGTSQEDLAVAKVIPSGTGLHRENLDADFSVSVLLSGCFGAKAWTAKSKD